MQLENLVIDAIEPQRLGRFWEAVLDGQRLTDEPDVFETRLAIEGGPVLDLCFQRVPEPPASPRSQPPRLHPDLLGGPRQDEEVERLLGIGARHLDIGQHDVPWVVLADPEGNPCCVMEERAAYSDTGPIAALPLDSADPDRDAEFWSWLTGWIDVVGVAPRTLRHPSLRGPLLELCPEQAPKGTTKNRLHLDVRLDSGGGRGRRGGADRRARRARAPPAVGPAAVAALRRPVRQRVLRAARAVVREGSARTRPAGSAEPRAQPSRTSPYGGRSRLSRSALICRCACTHADVWRAIGPSGLRARLRGGHRRTVHAAIETQGS